MEPFIYSTTLSNATNYPKLLIIGHARHGKDTVAEILKDVFGMTYISSSEAAAKIFLYDLLKEKYGYRNYIECFEDRINRRAEWFDAITEYNKDDRTRLARQILDTCDCYVGMRNADEIIACKQTKLVDLTVWVDASERLPQESSDSFQISKEMADIVIYNNGTLDDLRAKVFNFGNCIYD